jgi:hypothetical protein
MRPHLRLGSFIGWLFFGCLPRDTAQVAVLESVAVFFEAADLLAQV